MLDGQMVLLDNVFVHEQVVARAHELMKESGFEGAATEMRRAQHRLVDGDHRGAVHSAGSPSRDAAVVDLVDWGQHAETPRPSADGTTRSRRRVLINQRRKAGYRGW